MEIKNYKKRMADKKIERYLKLFGAVVIEGPKFCGKTWLEDIMQKANHYYM